MNNTEAARRSVARALDAANRDLEAAYRHRAVCNEQLVAAEAWVRSAVERQQEATFALRALSQGRDNG